jgi:hypothetical protein
MFSVNRADFNFPHFRRYHEVAGYLMNAKLRVKYICSLTASVVFHGIRKSAKSKSEWSLPSSP